VHRCCAPLYSLKGQIISRGKSDILAGDTSDWDAWFKELQVLGEYLQGSTTTDSASLGTIQTGTGIEFQLDALEQRAQISSLTKDTLSPELEERQAALKGAKDILVSFGTSRGDRIRAHRILIERPLLLAGGTVLILLGAYSLVYVLNRTLHARRLAWAIPHTPLGKGIILSGLTLFLLLLFACMLTNDIGLAALDTTPYPPGILWMNNISLIWGALLTLMVGFGVIYPALILPGTRVVCEKYATESNAERLHLAAKQSRRVAYVSFMRRYYSLLLGGFLCILCLWVIGFRIFEGTYPTQLKILSTGLLNEELIVVRQVLELLS
jgi:hypothetical protein